MKIDFGKQLFDEYAWKARVLPVLISIAPLTLIGFIYGWLNVLTTIISLLASLGIIFLLAQIARSLGKKTEIRLEAKWKGMPTTHMLRYATIQNSVIFKNRRRQIERFLKIKLPTKQQEAKDPEKADEFYVAATRTLISKIRQRKTDFPRVSEENINYGFRRNLFALKPIILFLLLIALITIVVTGLIFGFNVRSLLSLVILMTFGIIWILSVREAWVNDAANSYADRLFETLDDGLIS